MAFAIPKSTAPRASDLKAVHYWPLPPQKTSKHSSVSVSGSWCTQGMFEPSKHLWWIWGLILNSISPLLPSCWGFSFAHGCMISPPSLSASFSHHSSTTQMPIQCLPSCWDLSALGRGVSPHSRSSKKKREKKKKDREKRGQGREKINGGDGKEG